MGAHQPGSPDSKHPHTDSRQRCSRCYTVAKGRGVGWLPAGSGCQASQDVGDAPVLARAPLQHQLEAELRFVVLLQLQTALGLAVLDGASLGARVESGVRGCGGASGPGAGGDHLWVQTRGILGGCGRSGFSVPTEPEAPHLQGLISSPRRNPMPLFSSQGPSPLLGKRTEMPQPSFHLPSWVWHAGLLLLRLPWGLGSAPHLFCKSWFLGTTP